MRLDLLLVRLRLARSRARAQAWVAEGHMRCNRQRIVRATAPIAVGDILTLPLPQDVRVIEILALPDRRGPASEAQSCYRDLDARALIAIATPDRHKPVQTHEGNVSP